MGESLGAGNVQHYGTYLSEVSLTAQQRGKAFEHELSLSLLQLSPWPEPRMRDPVGGVGAEQPADYLTLLPGRALVIEAKSTIKPSWPLRNIHAHQVEGLRIAYELGHLAFLLINFRRPPEWNRCFAVGYVLLKGFMEEGTRASIPIEWCETHAVEIPRCDVWRTTEAGKAKKQKGWDLTPLLLGQSNVESRAL